MDSKYIFWSRKKANRIALGLIALSGMLFATASCSSAKGFDRREHYARIDVYIDGLKAKMGGRVYVALFYDRKGFESKGNMAAAIQRQVLGSTIHAVFTGDFSPGRYAIALFHDENNNGKLDLLGDTAIPAEGFGISNNPTFEKGAPTWDVASFPVQESETTVHIHTVYVKE